MANVDLKKINTKDIPWNGRTAEALRGTKFANLAVLDKASDTELMALPRIGEMSVREIRTQINRVKESGSIEGLTRIVFPRNRKSGAGARPEQVAAPQPQNNEQKAEQTRPQNVVAGEQDEIISWASTHESTNRVLMTGEIVLMPNHTERQRA